MTAIKTKKCSVSWDSKNKKTVFDYSDKDPFNKTIWYDADGNAYEMIYARFAKSYSLNPYPAYNRADYRKEN